MKKHAYLFLAVLMVGTAVIAEGNPMVGGAPMLLTKNIVSDAVDSGDHTTLVAAVEAAGPAETLQSPGPFTVFTPRNEAFSKLPAGRVDTLLKPENKDALTKVLPYHVVAGKMSSKDLWKAIKAGNGTATLETVSGSTFKAPSGKAIILTNEKGSMSRVTIAAVNQSNGVTHVADSVLLPQ